MLLPKQPFELFVFRSSEYWSQRGRLCRERSVREAKFSEERIYCQQDDGSGF